MSPRRYTHTLSLSVGGDTPTWEGEVTVSYEVNPAEPEVWPAYSHGGSPSVPAEAVDVQVTHIDGIPRGQRDYGNFEAVQLEDLIECNDALMSELLEFAEEADALARDAAMERLWEDRREASQ